MNVVVEDHLSLFEAKIDGGSAKGWQGFEIEELYQLSFTIWELGKKVLYLKGTHKMTYMIHQFVKKLIRESLEKRLSGWDRIDNLVSNENLVDQWIIDIMALANNNCDVESSAQFVFDIQSHLFQVSIEDLRARLSLSLNRFGEEIAAFRQYVDLCDTEDEVTIIRAIVKELESVEEGDFCLA